MEHAKLYRSLPVRPDVIVCDKNLGCCHWIVVVVIIIVVVYGSNIT
jgi:hypothetical protein